MCNTLLTALCDLQAFTSSAIIVAGFIQGPKLSFYHEEIIVRYWWLILNSIWAARRRAADETDVFMTAVHKILVIVAVCFAIAFQVRELVLQPHDWDFLDEKRCFLYDIAFGYDDSGQNIGDWYNLVGMTLYVAALSASLFKTTTYWLVWSEGRVRYWTGYWWSEAETEAKNLYNHFRGTANYPASSQPMSRLKVLKSTVMTTCCGTAGAALFSIHQYVAYWSYANGYEPIQVVLHSYHVIMETITLYELKSWNRTLIDGDEVSWGFGQCLPIILLTALLFSLCVTFREKNYKTE